MAQFQDLSNIYDGHSNYASRSQAISSGVEAAQQELEERRKQKQEEEDRLLDNERKAQLHEMQQLQLAQVKQAQYESLNVPANTGVVSADQYIQKASRNLVDQQAALVSRLKNNEIDTDEFAAQSAIIKNQVPALANTNKVLSEFQNNYTKLLESGQISDADNGEAARLYSAMQDGSIALEMAEDGNLMMVGDNINVPLNQINRIPKPIQKPATMEELASGPLSQIGDGVWDDDAVHTFVDKMFEGKDDVQAGRLLKSIAVDNLGIPLDRAEAMLNNPVDSESGATNELEEFVEKAIYNEAQTKYNADLLKRKQQESIIAQREAATQRQESIANNGQGLTPWQQQQLLQREKVDNFVNETVSRALDNGVDVNALQALTDGKITKIAYKPPTEAKKGMFGTSFRAVEAAPEKFGIYVKGEKTPRAVSRQELARIVSQIKLGTNSPINRNSPLEASRGARKAAQNEKTKAAHAARTSEQWDERRDDTKTYGDLALSAVKAIPGAALLGTAGSVISDAAGAAEGKGVGKARAKAIKAGVKAVGGTAKAAAKATGAVGLALAAKDIADTFNKVQFQGMSPEEQQKRRTITASQRRGGK